MHILLWEHKSPKCQFYTLEKILQKCHFSYNILLMCVICQNHLSPQGKKMADFHHLNGDVCADHSHKDCKVMPSAITHWPMGSFLYFSSCTAPAYCLILACRTRYKGMDVVQELIMRKEGCLHWLPRAAFTLLFLITVFPMLILRRKHKIVQCHPHS